MLVVNVPLQINVLEAASVSEPVPEILVKVIGLSVLNVHALGLVMVTEPKFRVFPEPVIVLPVPTRVYVPVPL